ncbi:MAG: hypothetical protein U5J83_03130 [Bryobacterales bacterium]|nr:hypothetical protein [Bryobacterales bacterium]
MQVEAATFANRVQDFVALRDFRVVQLELTGVSGEALGERRMEIDALLSDLNSSVPLDVFVEAFYREKELPSISIASEVPRVFVSKRSAVLLQFDGPPMWLPVGGSKLSFAVNTNWDIFYDNKSTFYYLLAGDIWLATHDPLGTEWVMPKSLPKELKNLPHTPDFANVWKHLPYEANPDVSPPLVFYSESAAELILIDGEPVLEPLVGGLAAIKNTSSDIFVDEATKRYYFLVAGRWFETGDLTGYWRIATTLPQALASIPESHPKAHILAHLPGTELSRKEAFRSTVPHLAIVRRSGPKVPVEFAGRPKYVPIDGTSLLWIPNATVPIVAQGSDLYACHHGIWFHASSPKGPWEVATSLPADIYRIPSRSPVFHLSFVRLVASDEKTSTFGYTGGYKNLFVHDNLVVYGAGFSHPPALQYGAYTYPIYFAQPATYGSGVWYDLKDHVFLRGRQGYGPFGGFGATCRFNSVTSHYFRAQTLYGDDLGDGPALAFLPYTAAYGKMRETYNPYATWGEFILNRASPPSQQAQRTGPGKTVGIQVGEPRIGPPDGTNPPPGTGFQPRKPQ